jgi:hypothetical protein
VAKRKSKKGRRPVRRVPLHHAERRVCRPEYAGDWEQELKGHARLTTHPVVSLGSGEVGYCMDPYRTDDCFRPCLATLAQIPPGQVPDPRIDDRLKAGEDPEEINRSAWDKIGRWTDAHGLDLVLHEPAPVERERWIGVIPHPGTFANHCVVMNRDRLWFDPAVSVKSPPGTVRLMAAWFLSEIAYGFTLERKE